MILRNEDKTETITVVSGVIFLLDLMSLLNIGVLYSLVHFKNNPHMAIYSSIVLYMGHIRPYSKSSCTHTHTQRVEAKSNLPLTVISVFE